MPARQQTPPYERPPTAQRAALDELRRWIISGRIKPGDQVVQEIVARDLGTSVIPVREALKTLESEGQLVHVPHKGFFVTVLSRSELLELCEIRSVLEALAVRRALPHVTASHLSRMADLNALMRAADYQDRIVDLVHYDRLFHFVVFEAAGVSKLSQLIHTMWDASDAYRAHFFNDPAHRACAVNEHDEIRTTVANGDPDRLIGQLDAHRLTPVESLVEDADQLSGSAIR